jgi:hypothetical protein
MAPCPTSGHVHPLFLSVVPESAREKRPTLLGNSFASTPFPDAATRDGLQFLSKPTGPMDRVAPVGFPGRMQT